MVAVSLLDQNILRRRFDGNALVSVGNLEIVNVAIVCADQIDTIRAPDIRPADCDIVDLEI